MDASIATITASIAFSRSSVRFCAMSFRRLKLQ
jgi:hypothetical protein